VGGVAFTSIVGFETKTEVIESTRMATNGTPFPSVMPSGKKPSGQVTIEWEPTGHTVFDDWHDLNTRAPTSARKLATIVINDNNGTPTRQYHLIDAWCSSITPSAFSAADSGAAKETILIVFNELVKE
jgi:phage tail-like protein